MFVPTDFDQLLTIIRIGAIQVFTNGRRLLLVLLHLQEYILSRKILLPKLIRSTIIWVFDRSFRTWCLTLRVENVCWTKLFIWWCFELVLVLEGRLTELIFNDLNLFNLLDVTILVNLRGCLRRTRLRSTNSLAVSIYWHCFNYWLRPALFNCLDLRLGVACFNRVHVDCLCWIGE